MRKPLIALMLAATLLLGACGGSSSGDSAEKTDDTTSQQTEEVAAKDEDTAAEPKDDGGEEVTVEWTMWASEKQIPTLEEMAAVAEKENPGIKVKLTTAPWGDYFTKLTTNLSSGNNVCVTSMNGPRLSTYAGAFEELTPEDLATAGIEEANFGEGALDILKNDGKLLGVPYDIATMVLYYNKDAFEAAGVELPTNEWTIDDFEKAAVAINKHGEMQGFGISPAEFQWLALPIAKSGKQPIAEDGTTELTDPAFLEAASWYAGLVTDKKVALPVASASDAGWGENQYSNGNAAMAVDGTWNATGYTVENENFEGGVVRLPQGENGPLSMILGSGYGIGKGCENKEAALKVLGSLVGEEAQTIMAKAGRSLPANKHAQGAYYDTLADSHKDNISAAFDVAFKGSQGQRSNAAWAKISEAFPQYLVGVYNGDDTMENALTTLVTQFDR